MAGRPDLMAGRKSLTVYEGMTGMIGERVHQREEPVGDDHGRRGDSRRRRERRDPLPGRPLRRLEPLRQGRQAGLHLQLGRACRSTRSTPSERLAPGKATIKLEFAYDGNGRGKGGTATLSINGKKVGSGRVERTNANIFSADDAADVGVDEGTNVSAAYKERDNKFTGKIEKVLVEVK